MMTPKDESGSQRAPHRGFCGWPPHFGDHEHHRHGHGGMDEERLFRGPGGPRSSERPFGRAFERGLEGFGGPLAFFREMRRRFGECQPEFDDNEEGFIFGGDESMFQGGGGRRGFGGPGPFGPFGRGHGRPGRPLEQGDLRWIALDLIAAQPRYGYEVIKAIEDAMHGHYAPSPGAVYPMLTLLEETGLISSETKGSKKLYQLTELGKAELEANQASIKSARERLNEASQRFGPAVAPPELFRAMENLRGALQVRLSKAEISPEALAAITEAIDKAAREIEKS
jgi:DNA-binding PadR family transcriptional regulator